MVRAVSYDGWVEMPDPEGGEPVELAEIGNHTSNCSRMWNWAYARATGNEGARLVDTDRKPLAEVADDLTKASDLMYSHADELREWAPENGWGSYESARAYLGRTAMICRRFRVVPGAVLRWDW
jgi:peptidoglycan/xylan/chitin deacetylase (PgdA/CDA1 family)